MSTTGPEQPEDYDVPEPPEYNPAPDPVQQPQPVPINPYSLLEAVNLASAAARGGWILFLALMTFVLIAVAGVTHKDLLLNSKVDLPIAQIGIELTRFFMFAPMIIFFIHFGILVQHVMLSRKVIEFDEALDSLEAGMRRVHPLRLELNSYFYSQAIAGPERSKMFGMFLHSMIWISFVALPVLLLLFIQIQFLPYHDELITWNHRFVLVADIALLALMGVFLRRPQASFFSAFWQTARRHPVNFTFTSILLAIVAMFSFFVVTIPGESLDLMTRTLPGYQAKSQCDEKDRERDFSYASFMFDDATLCGKSNGLAFFKRNLWVTDEDLVPDGETSKGETSFSLRERDLRFANLDRSDLHQADFTGAKLVGASMRDTNLRDAKFTCPALAKSIAEETGNTCADLRRVDLRGAKLDGANFSNADLSFATLRGAEASNTVFANARLVKTDFQSAEMKRADFAGLKTVLVMPNFLETKLQGANFTFTKIHEANFSNAGLEGANLEYASLVGGSLESARALAANLNGAGIYAAKTSTADFRGANLNNATIWQANIPFRDSLKLTECSGIQLKEPDSTALDGMRQMLTDIRPMQDTQALQEVISRLLDSKQNDAWRASDARTAWDDLKTGCKSRSTSEFRSALTTFVGELSCRVEWSDGAVASGVIERALGFTNENILVRQLGDKVAVPACETRIEPDLMQKLRTAIENQPTVDTNAASAQQ